MRMPSEEQLQRIIEIAILKLDLRYTKELMQLQKNIPELISNAINACQKKHARTKRWNTSTFANSTSTCMGHIVMLRGIACKWV